MTISDITPIVAETTNTEIFSCAEFGDLTVLEIDNEPWFVGKEVAEKLGYSNDRDAIARHVDEERFKNHWNIRLVVKHDTLHFGRVAIIQIKNFPNKRVGFIQFSSRFKIRKFKTI